MANIIRQLGLLQDVNDWFSGIIKDIHNDSFGMYVNPDNEDEFRNTPYPSQRLEIERHTFLYRAIGGTDLIGEYFKILKKKSNLSRSQRNYIVKIIKEYNGQ